MMVFELYKGSPIVAVEATVLILVVVDDGL